MGSQTEPQSPSDRRVSVYGQAKSDRPGLEKEAGFISVLIILIITLLAYMGVEGLFLVQSRGQYIKEEEDRMKCIYLAEGGLEWAKASLSTNPEWSGGTMSYPDDEVKLSVKKNEEDYLVISEVESGLARRKIQVTLQKREGNIEITRYEELHNQ